jgi:hypothetical protein
MRRREFIAALGGAGRGDDRGRLQRIRTPDAHLSAISIV